VPATAAARLQRWAMFLGGLQYTIKYKSGKLHANADLLSRLPLPALEEDKKHIDTVGLFHVQQIELLPLSASDLSKETQRDPVLSKVYQATLHGWSSDPEPELKAYHRRKNELTVQGGCLLWGVRVVVPPRYQQRVLEELHTGHMGVVKMKGLGRGHVWWPNFDSDVEGLCNSCSPCQLTQTNPAAGVVHMWEYPEQPWSRVHIDFAGPEQGKMLLVVVDAHSKWPEVKVMSSTTASKTIEVLREIFARQGLPAQLVSDNGPQFTSAEFAEFLRKNGVRHVTSAPYHPRTNGLAERFVRTMKAALKSDTSTTCVKLKLDRFLLAYRNCPHATTGETPAKLLTGRPLRSRLDLLRPDMVQKVKNKYATINQQGSVRTFYPGETVLARNYARGDPWVIGTVLTCTGPLSYLVKVGSVTWRRHVDQMRNTGIQAERVVEHNPLETELTPQVPTPIALEPELDSSATGVPVQIDMALASDRSVPSDSVVPVARTSPSATRPPVVVEPVTIPVSRPKRTTREPSYFKDFVRT